MTNAHTAIYEPPHADLPFLVVTISDEGISTVPAESRLEARMTALSLEKDHREQSHDSEPQPD